MLNEQQQSDLTQRVSQSLDNDIAQIDELTLAKLKSARLNALEKGKVNNQSWPSRLLSGQGMMASAAAILIVVLAVNRNSPELSGQSDLMTAFMNPVLQEDPDMLAELEFVTWLEMERLVEQVEKS